MNFESNEDLCKFVRELGHHYEKRGIGIHGNRLLEIVNEAAFSSSSEMLGEILLVLHAAIEGDSERMTVMLRDDSKKVMGAIVKSLEEVGHIVDDRLKSP